MCSLPSPLFRDWQLRAVLTRRMPIGHPDHGLLDHLLGLGGHVANVLLAHGLTQLARTAWLRRAYHLGEDLTHASESREPWLGL